MDNDSVNIPVVSYCTVLHYISAISDDDNSCIPFSSLHHLQASLSRYKKLAVQQSSFTNSWRGSAIAPIHVQSYCLRQQGNTALK